MDEYGTAEICMGGHVTTLRANKYPEFRRQFCEKCGERTTTTCLECNTWIRGAYDVPGVIGFSDDYTVPAFCHNCGKAYPWTAERLDAAMKPVDIAAQLTDEEDRA